MSKLFNIPQTFRNSAPKMRSRRMCLVLALAWNAGVPLLALALAGVDVRCRRRFAGFDRGELQNDSPASRVMGRLERSCKVALDRQRQRVAPEDRQEGAIQLASPSESVEENNRLKEDLAFF